jgi:hypothetical protein
MIEFVMRRLAPLGIVLIISIACATDKPPATDGGPAKSDTAAHEGAAEAEVGGVAQDEAADGEAGAACQTDADCVAAECCHPASCVPVSAAPSCSDTMCTEECRGGTMDCGQGHCGCQNGSCAAVIDKPLD